MEPLRQVSDLIVGIENLQGLYNLARHGVVEEELHAAKRVSYSIAARTDGDVIEYHSAT